MGGWTDRQAGRQMSIPGSLEQAGLKEATFLLHQVLALQKYISTPSLKHCSTEFPAIINAQLLKVIVTGLSSYIQESTHSLYCQALYLPT